MTMKTRYRKWKRRGQAVKRGWMWMFSDSTSNGSGFGATAQQSKGFNVQKLHDLKAMPHARWHETEDGGRIYGPVRDEHGWGYTDERGNWVHHSAGLNKVQPSKNARNQRIQPDQKKRRCNQKCVDGTRCKFVGNCPHHKKRIRL